MKEVTVTVPATLVWVVNSKLMLLIGALTGVSVTFIPCTLFELGRSQATYRDLRVQLCLAVIYLVPAFYIHVGGRVIFALLEHSRRGRGGAPPSERAAGDSA